MAKKWREVCGWQIGEPAEIRTTSLYRAVNAEVRCPRTGEERVFSRFIFGDWVNILALTEQHEIVLVRQFRFGTESMEWELPGGLIENGEEPLAAGVRELEEETGYIGAQSEVLGTIYPNPAIQDNTLYTILVQNAEKRGNLKPDPMEDIETRLVPFDEMSALLKGGEIHHSFTYTALMHYALRNNLFTLV